MNARWQKILQPLSNLAKGGLVLAVGFFVFQITQSWCDHGQGPSREIIRWVLPLLVSALACLILTIIFSISFIDRLLVASPPQAQPSSTPAEALANAILDYGRQLHKEARDQAVVNLRTSFSTTLHILGFHEHRAQLGEIALQSAVVLSDSVAKSEILVDDLGWANYLLGREEIALQNIERGVEMARTMRTASGEVTNILGLALCQAKGLRHLAVIRYRARPEESAKSFEAALSILASLDQNVLEVQRDTAQVYHAQAMTAAMRLGVHQSGTVRLGDTEGIEAIDSALTLTRQSSKIFAAIADRERYAKALALEVRLLEARHSDTEAKEVAAIRDRTLASSAWVRPEGIRTLTGV